MNKTLKYSASQIDAALEKIIGLDTSIITNLTNNKYDNVTISGNTLSFYANGNMKKSINLPSGGSSGGGSGTDGREIELSVQSGYIAWRYKGDSSWTNLVSLESLKGATGATGANGTNATINGMETLEIVAGTNISIEKNTSNKTITINSTGSSGSGGSSVEIVNDLTTGGANKALSAEQGKVLNSQLENVKTNLATDLKLTGNKLQLKKSNGSVIGTGIDLPVGDGSGGSVDLSAYQTKEDSNIIGVEKTIVGSINNNYNKIQSLDNQINIRKLVNLKTTRIKNAETYLNIPTYDGLDQIVHTKVLYFKNGWNGYKFWMGHTPLPYIPQVDESKENPCIMVSNDGENWITPSGLTNPLDTPQAVKCQYLSDTHLVFKDNKLELWYRSFNPEIIYKKVSSDGVNWGERIEIMKGTGRSIVCPAVIFDENKYKLWVVKEVTPSQKYILDYMESDNGINFTHIRDIELSNKLIGHHDVIKTEYGYECIFHERGDQRVYYTRSLDNITWDTCVEKLTVIPNSWQNNKLYRPNLTVVDGDYYLYYTGGLSTQGAKIALIKITGTSDSKVQIPARNVIQDEEHVFISGKNYKSMLKRLATIEEKLNINLPSSDLFPCGDIFTFKKGINLTTSRWTDASNNGVYMTLNNITDISNGIILNGTNGFGSIDNCTFKNNVSYTVSIKFKYNVPVASKLQGKVLYFSNALNTPVPRCIRVEGKGVLAYDGNKEVVHNKTILDSHEISYTVDFVYEDGGSTDGSTYTVYVNGENVGTGKCPTRDADFTHMLIGKQLDTVNQFASANVYYVTAYSKALTAMEVLEKYSVGI